MKYNSIKTNSFCEPYIIAEIGANHNGDMELAMRLIESAKKCGCDCVKFQSWTTSSILSKVEYENNRVYTDSKKKHFGSLYEMVEKYYLRPEQHKELKIFCDKIGIDFASSPFSNEEVDMLIKLDVPFIKLASMDINNFPLLKHVALKNKPLIVSTGMSTIAEIDKAVSLCKSEGNKDISLLHCISIYPPEYEDINLNNIPMLKEVFGCEVGFSDHTIGFSIPLAAVALGAVIIEKHFTLDKNLPGWDHEISANPREMKIIVEESKHIVKSLGSKVKIVSNAEKEKLKKFRRSVVLKRELKKGYVLKLDDLDFKRPGTGIAPNEYDFVVGRQLKVDKNEDDLLMWEDLV